MSDANARASDPGIRLFQLDRLKWVHCPRCDGPARQEWSRLTCLRCPYREGHVPADPRRLGEVMLKKSSPSCERRQCGAPIPSHGRAARGDDGGLLARVKCPTCGHVGRYPALPVTPWSAARAWARIRCFWRGHPLYLQRKVAGHTLFVYNLEHLDMLETWLGAKLRERGPVAGLTMMARLPRWMKSAKLRPKVLEALAGMREQALRDGLS